MNKNKKLIMAVTELMLIDVGQIILGPDKLLYVCHLSKKTIQIIGINTTIVLISRRSIKHIIERRGLYAEYIFSNMPTVLMLPTKIIDNSSKRENSFILAKEIGKIVGVVIEITKTPDRCQVVSAFFMRPNAYKEFSNYSGRAELPPFELSP